jgi:hypothetical protein
MHLEDMVPETVIFTVDFFNALYVATCMQAATSTLSIVAITLTDLTQTNGMLYGLHRQTATLSAKLHARAASDSGNQDKLLSVLASLCRNPAKFKKQTRDGIRPSKPLTCGGYQCFRHAERNNGRCSSCPEPQLGFN